MLQKYSHLFLQIFFLLQISLKANCQVIDIEKIDPGFYGYSIRDTIYCKAVIVIVINNVKYLPVKYIYTQTENGKLEWYDDKKKKINVFMYLSGDSSWKKIQ